jgi:hypothetical protein
MGRSWLKIQQIPGPGIGKIFGRVSVDALE